jgi:hypothetical protein
VFHNRLHLRRCRLPPDNGRPLPPQRRCPTRDVMLTRHQPRIHPLGLPLACGTRSERTPLDSASSFQPGRCQPRTSRWGQVWNLTRATSSASCRTSNRRTTHTVRPRVARCEHAATSAPSRSPERARNWRSMRWSCSRRRTAGDVGGARPTAGDRLQWPVWEVAGSAAGLVLSGQEPTWRKQCPGEGCSSTAGSHGRRWCTSAMCGNRERARCHCHTVHHQ